MLKCAMALEILKESAEAHNAFIEAALIVCEQIRCKKSNFKDMPLKRRVVLYSLTMAFASLVVVGYPILVPLAPVADKFLPTPQSRK